MTTSINDTFAMMEKSKGAVKGEQGTFSANPSLKKEGKETSTKGSAVQQPHSLRDTFDLLDKDKGGTISFEELKSAMSACDRKISDDELRDVLRSRGLNPNTLALDYDGFCNFMGGESSSTRISLTDVHKFFHALDLDGSGYLTAAELRHVMTNMSLPSNDGIMDEMIAMYDLDGNGQVQVEEFVELVKGLGMEVYGDLAEEKGNEDIHAATSADSDLFPGNSEEEKKEEPAIVVPIESFPEELRHVLTRFDFAGTGCVAEADLLRAAELLKIEKMAGAHDPEANPALHWSKGREKRGLGEVIYKANHIALIVEDIGRSATFYSDVLGFQQIRRPNFDRHGAWFTMGNLELHLIKGKPLVHSGDDLIVGHISIETFGIDKVPGLLREMNVPFRQNVSVPKGSDAGGTGTNSSNSSKKIVRQYFFRDPDGYYIEVCNCDVLTQFCLGAKAELETYEEGAKPITVEDAGKLIGLMQRWSSTGGQEKENREDLIERAKATDMSLSALAHVLGCTEAATEVDSNLLASLLTRQSVYGDICQNMTSAELEEVLLVSKNNVPLATKIMKLRADVEGTRRVQAPAFYEDGNVLVKPKTTMMEDDL